MVHDLRTKQITLIEVGITNKDILANTETTKWRKYELLANELKCMYQGHSVEIIPVVMTWDGLVTHHFKKYMKKLEVKNRLLGYIQSVVLKRTCESILIDCRREEDEIWMDEELSAIMERMETNPDGTETE